MNEEIEITPDMVNPEGYRYPEWFICPNCGGDNIERCFNYCPDCGKKLIHILKVNNEA